ncbi:MAG: homocysteine S-methyltransferase family protein [Steroidobacteraceae bacterium]|nr:homocysteine S-methyltransferase family protein [Deltaproteobacteria bacterium]
MEAVGKHAPSLTTLKKYAHAVGCHLEIKFVPEHAQRLLANTAALSPEDLNDSTSLVEEDPETFGKSVAGLNRELGLKILGGCCGTDNRHIRSLAAQLATGMNKNEKKGAD